MTENLNGDQGVPERRRPAAVAWVGLACLGVVLYGLTYQPAIALAPVCLRFAWRDFGTANWFRRNDPWPSRGRACWCLYAAYGLWKAVGVAISANLVVGLSLLPLVSAQRYSSVRFGAIAVVVCGLAVASVFIATAVEIARRKDFKLWLDRPGSPRPAGDWPPRRAGEPEHNMLGIVYATTVFPHIVGLLLLLRTVAQPWGVDMCLLGPVWVLLGALYSARIRSVTASSPDECYS